MKQSFLIPRSQHNANRKQQTTTGGEIGIRQTPPSMRLVPDFAEAPWEHSPSWTGKDCKVPSPCESTLTNDGFQWKAGLPTAK